jgi:hypothetical protein
MNPLFGTKMVTLGMSTRIYYFSGTGNSLMIARAIAAELVTFLLWQPMLVVLDELFLSWEQSCNRSV